MNPPGANQGTGANPGAGIGTGAPCSSLASGHPESKWGGAITAGLQLKNLPTGVGDTLNIDATFAKGDTKAVISTSGASPSFAMFRGTGTNNPSVGFGYVSDGVYGNGNSLNGNNSVTNGIQLTNAFGFRGGYIHNWDPNWQSSLFGSASFVRYNNTAAFAYCNSVSGNPLVGWGNRGANPTSTCDPNFNVYQVGFRTGWTPVKGLTFSGEVFWSYLDQNWSGTTRPFWVSARPSWPPSIPSRTSRPRPSTSGLSVTSDLASPKIWKVPARTPGLSSLGCGHRYRIKIHY